MRTFEIFLILSLVVQLVWPLMPASWLDDLPLQQEIGKLPILSVALAVIQIVVEGYRWQMLPAFLLTALLFLNLFRSKKPIRFPKLLIIGGWLLLLVAAIMPAIVPIPTIAPLTGNFAVGTVSFHLVDADRLEPFAPQPNQPREVMMQIWYPTNRDSEGEPVPFIDNFEIVSRAIADQFDMPAFFLNHLNLAHPHALKNVPIAGDAGTFPLLLFSHGLGGIRAQNTFQVEQLASHGYVVAAIDHTYASAVTVLPENRVVFFKSDMLDFSTPESTYQTSNALITTWAGDLELMLDTLTTWNENDSGNLLAGRLDLNRVGVFGHSTGGGATVEFCARDSRCKAALLLDAWLQPVTNEIFDGVLTQPVMTMEESNSFFSYPSHEERTQWTVDKAAAGYYLEIAGTKHFDFSDMPLISPLTDFLNLTGRIPPRRVHQIINDYSLAFFDQSLRGLHSPLLDAPSLEYPEVTKWWRR